MQAISTITAAQDSQAARFISPLVSFSVFSDYMANRETRKPTNQKEGAPLKLLPFVLQERIRLRAISFLPVLVNFYKLITSSFSYRLTEQQAMELTVPQCIDVIRTMDRQAKTKVADTLTKNWEEFKAAWSRIKVMLLSFGLFLIFKEIRDMLAELEGCPDQERNRRFESYITLVNNDTLLGSLVSHPSYHDQHDEIYRVINELIKKQNSVCLTRILLHKIDLLQILQKREDYEKWNTNSLLFEERSVELNLNHLPSDSGTTVITVITEL